MLLKGSKRRKYIMHLLYLFKGFWPKINLHNGTMAVHIKNKEECIMH